ncbi:hypothetical protein [Synechocystis sp. LKSZ1]|uniref:hypothetical protein n=1 Tax=Synechocystis sp. LKSZ1 TaxID=3144951 RepID=UPI00336BD11B
MPFLLLVIGLLFVGVELFQWFRSIILPLPVYVLGGAFLAIASNYDRGLSLVLGRTNTVAPPAPETISVIVEPSTPSLASPPDSPALPPTDS